MIDGATRDHREVDRRIRRLAIPAFGALIAEPLYRLVDTAIIGRVGTTELGGVAIASTLLSLVVAGSNFLAYGTTQRVAQLRGADRDRDAANAAAQALWLGALIGTLAAVVLIAAAGPLIGAFGGEDAVADAALEYLRISAMGLPFVVLGIAAQGGQRGAQDFRSALVILVAANIVNAATEVLFVLGWFWGVAGAAWSTVIAQIGAGTALVARTLPVTGGADRRTPQWAEMRHLLGVGRFLLLRVGAMLVVFSGSTSVAARLGDATLAAHSIAIAMFGFLAIGLDALAVPAQTLVADEIGKGGSDAGLVAARAQRMSVMCGVIVAGALIVSAPWIVRLFTADAEVVDLGAIALALLGVQVLPASVAFATDGILIGAADFRFLGIAAVGYLLVIVPLGAAILALPQLGIVGLWAALIIWMLLRAIVNHHRVQQLLGPPVGL